MAFTYGCMTYASNAAEPAFEFFQDLIAAGWRVRGSSNYSSYENFGVTDGTTGTGAGGQYDLITNVTALTQKVLNTGTAWIRFATPADAPVYREFLFYTQFRGSVVHTDWRFEWARQDYKFETGGGAGTPPTATRAVAMGSRQPVRQNSANDCSTYAAPAGDNWYAWTIGDVDENYDFVFWSWKNRTSSPGALYSAFGSLYLGDTFLGNGTDNDPYLYINVARTSDGTPAYTAVNNFYEARHTLSTRQETTTSATIAPGVYASYKLDDYADETKFGTWRVGLAPSAPMASGAETHTSELAEILDSSFEGLAYAGNGWLEGFYAVHEHPTEAVKFLKGYCSSNLLKIGHRSTSVGQPYLMKEEGGSQYYANFQGLCFAWESKKGIPT